MSKQIINVGVSPNDGLGDAFRTGWDKTNFNFTELYDKSVGYGVFSSSELSTALSDKTGTGVAVFGTSPTFITDITTPMIIGGTSTTSKLKLRATSGVGTTGSDIVFQTGNNGSRDALVITQTGWVFQRNTGASGVNYGYRVFRDSSAATYAVWSTGEANYRQILSTNGWAIASTQYYGWTSATTITAVEGGSVDSPDTTIRRGAAGRVTIGSSANQVLVASKLGAGLGNADPSAIAHFIGTTEQVRVGYDTTNYFSTTVNSTGSVTFDLTGTTPTFTFAKGINLNAVNIATDTTTGTKIGTSTTQKLGFWNATPIVQPTTAITAATFTANTSGIVDDTATFDGYTLGQIVKALRNMGVLA